MKFLTYVFSTTKDCVFHEHTKLQTVYVFEIDLKFNFMDS